MGMHPTGVGVPGLGMTPGAPGAQPQPAVASAPAAAAADTSMDELMAKLNADLAKDLEQPKSEPQRKAGRATAEELSRQFSGRISAEPVPAGAAATGRPGGERGEEAGRGGRPVDDIPIELPPEPASKGASSSRTPAEKPAVPSKPKGVMPRPFSSNPFHRRKASPPKKKEVEPLEPVPVPVAVEAAVSRPILGDYAPAAPAELPNGMPQVLPEAMDVWAQQMAGSWEQQAARQSADPEADARFRMMAAKFRADVQQWKEDLRRGRTARGTAPTPGREGLPPNPDGPVKPGPVSPGLVQGKGAGKDAGGLIAAMVGDEGFPVVKRKRQGRQRLQQGGGVGPGEQQGRGDGPCRGGDEGQGQGQGQGRRRLVRRSCRRCACSRARSVCSRGTRG
ncbi:unnamed protein product [Prorocentrum cordatum]|uniref:Uncharacterized protein n=1 Tax=Prorocentrum cordatum TaxID=2364126 RepID=A0ABN9U7K1_9DINO|nr:unnamed protein product [Polarella glacialis]